MIHRRGLQGRRRRYRDSKAHEPPSCCSTCGRKKQRDSRMHIHMIHRRGRQRQEYWAPRLPEPPSCCSKRMALGRRGPRVHQGMLYGYGRRGLHQRPRGRGTWDGGRGQQRKQRPGKTWILRIVINYKILRYFTYESNRFHVYASVNDKELFKPRLALCPPSLVFIPELVYCAPRQPRLSLVANQHLCLRGAPVRWNSRSHVGFLVETRYLHLHNFKNRGKL